MVCPVLVGRDAELETLGAALDALGLGELREELLDLDLASAPALCCADQRVIDRMVEVVNVTGVGPEFASEIFCIQRRFLCAGIAVQPRKISPSEGLSWRRFRF